MSEKFMLKNDSLLLVAEAPGGIYNGDQLNLISELSQKFGSTVKVTEDHRISLVVSSENISEVETSLKQAGISVRPYKTGLSQPVSCLGGLCPLHQQDALDTSLKISESLPTGEGLPNLTIGLNGCSRTCVPTHTLDFNIMGDEVGYRVSIGGKNSYLPEMASFLAEGVPADKLPDLVTRSYELYRNVREGDETLGEVIERLGTSQFVELFSPYSQDAASDGDPFALDFAAPEPETVSKDSDNASSEEQAHGEVLSDETSDEGAGVEELGIEDVSLELDASQDLGASQDLNVTQGQEQAFEEMPIDDLAVDDLENITLDESASQDLAVDMELDDGLDSSLELSAEIDSGSDLEDSLLDAVDIDADYPPSSLAPQVSDDLNLSSGVTANSNLNLSDSSGEVGGPVEESSHENLEVLEAFKDDLEVDSEVDSEANLDGGIDEDLLDADLDEDEKASQCDSVSQSSELENMDLENLELDDTSSPDLDVSEADVNFENGEEKEVTLTALTDENFDELSLDDDLDDLEFELEDLTAESVSSNQDDRRLAQADETRGLSASETQISADSNELVLPETINGEKVVVGEENDEDKFEKAFDEDIDSYSEEDEFKDENAGDRQAAMSIIENSIEDSPEEDTMNEELDDEIVSELDQVIESELGVESHLSESTTRDASNLERVETNPRKNLETTSQGWDVSNVDVSSDGVCISFSGGVKLELDSESISSSQREFKIGNAMVSVTQADSGYKIKINGVAVFVPDQAVA